mmetsp:Transcript_19228/g.28627  ORF Transcript_19228/g.28627 Transcript_19228/m.28627 type:complete len:439 (+) Transcript_19228:89-1405(+)
MGVDDSAREARLKAARLKRQTMASKHWRKSVALSVLGDQAEKEFFQQLEDEKRKQQTPPHDSSSLSSSSSKTTTSTGAASSSSSSKATTSGWTTAKVVDDEKTMSTPGVSDKSIHTITVRIHIPSLDTSFEYSLNPHMMRVGQLKTVLLDKFKGNIESDNASSYELCLLYSPNSSRDDDVETMWLLEPEMLLASAAGIEEGAQLEFSLFNQEPVEIEGYLLKLGQKGIKTWKKRWFATHGNRLLYYSENPAHDPSLNALGFIQLGSGTTLKEKPESQPDLDENLVFELCTGARVWYLQVEDADDKPIWVQALSGAIEYWNANKTDWKEGFLTKRGGLWKSWLVRWFILHSDVLEYYEAKEGSHYLKGKIPLYRASVKAADTSNDKIFKGRMFGFSIETSDRIFYLCANSDKDRTQWIEAIEKQKTIIEKEIERISFEG